MRMEIKKKSLTLALRNLKRSTSPTPTKRETKIVIKTSMPNSPIELPTSLLCRIVTKRLNTIIPIISEKKSKKLKPDYYLVMPWHFKNEILKREKKFLKDGGKIIMPLPKLQVL